MKMRGIKQHMKKTENNDIVIWEVLRLWGFMASEIIYEDDILC